MRQSLWRLFIFRAMWTTTMRITGPWAVFVHVLCFFTFFFSQVSSRNRSSNWYSTSNISSRLRLFLCLHFVYLLSWANRQKRSSLGQDLVSRNWPFVMHGRNLLFCSPLILFSPTFRNRPWLPVGEAVLYPNMCVESPTAKCYPRKPHLQLDGFQKFQPIAKCRNAPWMLQDLK